MKRYFPMLAAGLLVLGYNFALGSSETQNPGPAGNNANDRLEVTPQDASARQAKAQPTARLNLDTQGIILKGYDAVAYFKQGKPVKGDPEIESVYQGATYRFASSLNKADFDKDPAKYAPQYGAFCAYGITNGVLFDPEGPGAFALYKGKLYVCGNQGALKSFKNDIDGNIEKGNLNWRSLSKP